MIVRSYEKPIYIRLSSVISLCKHTRVMSGSERPSYISIIAHYKHTHEELNDKKCHTGRPESLMFLLNALVRLRYICSYLVRRPTHHHEASLCVVAALWRTRRGVIVSPSHDLTARLFGIFGRIER